jgi:hypothetical protein
MNTDPQPWFFFGMKRHLSATRVSGAGPRGPSQQLICPDVLTHSKTFEIRYIIL